MKIFAVVVSYNGLKWYDRCFGSLEKSDIPVSIVVVDNASTDNSIVFLKKNYPDIILIESRQNLGFARANNIGIKYALEKEADYVFLLNQDAWVETNTIAKLLKTFEINRSVGIASPIHLNGSYTNLDKGFFEYMDKEFYSDCYMKRIKLFYEVKFVNAAAWMISKECIKKVGGFDTSLFFHYGEDNNYCQRVYFHGFRILISTQCTICHDREYRNDDDYTKGMLAKNPFLNEKILYGNINYDINLQNLIHQERFWIILSIIRLSKKKAYFHKEKLLTFQRIEQSREMNKKGGLIWF